MEKLSKKEVDFEHPGMGEDSCGKCQFFLSTGGCTLVEGKIEKSDWCNHFAPKSKHTAAEPLRKEHDTVKSRITGESVEIGPSYTGGGYVFANPFASLSESRFAHANPEKFGGKKGLEEWDKSTDYKNLPEKKAHTK